VRLLDAKVVAVVNEIECIVIENDVKHRILHDKLDQKQKRKNEIENLGEAQVFLV